MPKYHYLHIKRGPFEYVRIGNISYVSLFGFKFFKQVGNVAQLLAVNWVKPYAS